MRFLAAESSDFSLLVSPRDQTAVDPVLTPPGIDRLRTDLQVVRHLGDAATRLDQVEDLPTKLRRVGPVCPL